MSQLVIVNRDTTVWCTNMRCCLRIDSGTFGILLRRLPTFCGIWDDEGVFLVGSAEVVSLMWEWDFV